MNSLHVHGFTSHDLGDGHQFFSGSLPADLVWDASRFDEAWNLHPTWKQVIMMFGTPTETPRWQQAYGADYRYTGQTNHALPVPDFLAPLRTWARETIDPRLNGLLLNWYDGAGHYIGPHHDDTRDLVPGSPIVTMSFGDTRVFRLTRTADGVKGRRDFPAANGVVFVMSYATNLVWKHSVPKSARYRGRRISHPSGLRQDRRYRLSTGKLRTNRHRLKPSSTSRSSTSSRSHGTGARRSRTWHSRAGRATATSPTTGSGLMTSAAPRCRSSTRLRTGGLNFSRWISTGANSLGLTAAGWATVARLRMNAPVQVMARLLRLRLRLFP